MGLVYFLDCSALTKGIMEDLRIFGKQLSELETSQKCKSIQIILLILDQLDRIKFEEGQEILDWLSPLNFWRKQKDTLERRQEGTGEWFIKHPEFRKWIEGDTQFLWCPGDRKTSSKQC